MHNCIILGTGRSGTSMVAGALASSGYYMGDDLHAARSSNPKGFFESSSINNLNEELLAPVIPDEQGLTQGQRWLGYPASSNSIEPTREQAGRMDAALGKAPFCHKDPRFAFTLPAWQSLLGEARTVCVFRHPGLTVKSMLEECKRANYLQDLKLDQDHFFQLWIAAHRSILAGLQSGGHWMFIHYDQVLTKAGLDRLGSFLEAPVDTEFPDSKLRRSQTELQAPPEAIELYEELCRLAAHELGDSPENAQPEAPDCSFLTIIEDGDEIYCGEMLEDAMAQRGLKTEVVFIDKTAAGQLEVEGARVIRCDSPSRGTAWRAGLAATTSPLIAWLHPGNRLLPSHLAYAQEALEAQPNWAMVRCDYYLHDSQGQFCARADTKQMAAAPGPCWESGSVLRRETLAEISELAFHPVELKLWKDQCAQGTVGYVSEPGYSVAQSRYEAEAEAARREAQLIACRETLFQGERPDLTVSIVSFNRKEILLEGIESFCRQHLPHGTFEIVVVNDGSTDGTREVLDSLTFPVPVTVIHQKNGGIATARNTGLESAMGRYVLFVNDDTIALPDCVEQHLRTHSSFPVGTLSCVLGHFEQPIEELSNAMVRHLELTNDVFCYVDMTPNQFHSGQYFYTCNVSVETAAVRRVGAFDEAFKHYGCEDTDLALRLEGIGYRVYYQPLARAVHRHIMDFEYLSKRQFTVARAYVRFFRKHPSLMDQWGNQDLTLAHCQSIVDRAASGLGHLEAACRALGATDVGALEALGGEFNELAQSVMLRLKTLVTVLNTAWWHKGYIYGFEEHGIAGLHELKLTPNDPLPLPTESERRLFAWPDWADPRSMDQLMETIAPVAQDSFAALILYRDPTQDVDQDQALEALQAAYAKHFGDSPEASLEVHIDSTPKDRYHLVRFGRSINAVIPSGREPEGFLDQIVAERLTDRAAVARWRRRYEDPFLTRKGQENAAPVEAGAHSIHGEATPKSSPVLKRVG